MHTSIATILERRKNTARYLKQAIDQVSCLEELQVDELKQQIKVSQRAGISMAIVARYRKYSLEAIVVCTYKRDKFAVKYDNKKQ